jgi:isopentenyl-diphosphate delta-isomerase
MIKKIMQRYQVVLVDKNDKVVGYKDKLEAHKNPVPLHRAVSVLIFNSGKDKVLIQKRSKNKPTWPLYWSNTVCTHPMRTESYKDTAKRRLKEEMGIKTDVDEEFKFIYKNRYDKTFGEHELDCVLTGVYEGGIRPDPNEVADYRWIEVGKLKRDVVVNCDKYTPWFMIILKKLEII